MKVDFTRAFETTNLPTDLTNRYIYSNNKTRYSNADSLFATLGDHYKLYKKQSNPLQVTAPTGYTPFRSVQGKNVPNLAAVNGSLVAAVVTRVSVVFSLVSRVAHDHWVNTIPSRTGYSLWQAGSLDNTKTKNVFSGAGWDYRSGYIVDWLRPTIGGKTADNKDLGVFGVRPTDNVNVQVSPLMPTTSGGKFNVEFQATVGKRDTAIGIYEYQYGTQAELTEILESGNHTTIGKVKYPFQRERAWNVSEITLGNPTAPISAWGSAPKQFAVFTLGARTANDSLYPGKPGRTSSFVQHVLQMDASKSHPALLPMEMSLLPITVAGANTVGSVDADDADRAFHFSGTSRGNGSIHYVSQNLPTTPLVNLANLRHANLASSGHLPLIP